MILKSRGGLVVDGARSGSPARFAAPELLRGLDPEAVGSLLAATADVTFVLDGGGTILDAAIAEADLAGSMGSEWIGKRLVDTVTIESRAKIEELIRDSSPRLSARGRQVNHPSARGADIPIRYRALRFGEDGRIVAVGRDLRQMAALQQRLVEAQQEMEREYTRIRNAEKRYRLLYQLASEAVLILDSGTARIVEANPAAAILLGVEPKKLAGRDFEDLFADSSRQTTRSFLAATRVAPRVDRVHAQLGHDHGDVLMTGSSYRQDGVAHLVVLLSRLGDASLAASADDANILRLVEAIPEALVVVAEDGRIMTANAAFLDLVQATTVVQARGESIERWIGRPGVDIDVLFSNLRAHGSVRIFSTVARGELGTVEDVEIVAASAVGGATPIYGLAIRATGWRGGRERLGGRELPRTVEQFTELVGRVPMKNLVRETTDLIERLCIEAALELTRENRASAAEMLGLSRQAFYVKLRRYGLADGGDGDGQER
ncbi:transcriptional regulator PpsR [Roseiarcus fermentans]|uniref:transcriptional regulator PpsR n=1 Tax=Roseiarcus fermentans TaxID=1473586 RepID=UPI00315DFE87